MNSKWAIISWFLDSPYIKVNSLKYYEGNWTNYLNLFVFTWLISCTNLSNDLEQWRLESCGHDFVFSCGVYSWFKCSFHSFVVKCFFPSGYWKLKNIYYQLDFLYLVFTIIVLFWMLSILQCCRKPVFLLPRPPCLLSLSLSNQPLFGIRLCQPMVLHNQGK